MKFVTAVVILIALTSSCEARCEAPRAAYTPEASLTAGQLIEIPDSFLIFYIQGYVDSLFYSSGLSATNDCVKSAQTCLAGKTIPQLVAIVRKAIKSNPEYWHTPAALQVFAALLMPCVYQ